jgi:hypothetical protein
LKSYKFCVSTEVSEEQFTPLLRVLGSKNKPSKNQYGTVSLVLFFNP